MRIKGENVPGPREFAVLLEPPLGRFPWASPSGHVTRASAGRAWGPERVRRPHRGAARGSGSSSFLAGAERGAPEGLLAGGDCAVVAEGGAPFPRWPVLLSSA